MVLLALDDEGDMPWNFFCEKSKICCQLGHPVHIGLLILRLIMLQAD